MMKRFLLLVWMLVFFVCAISAEKVIPLPNLTKPGTMAVDESQIYVTQGAQIHIFDKKDGKLKKEFGKEGEGPREFRILANQPGVFSVFPREKDLVINSYGKVSLFSKSGEFINEMKTPPGLFSGLYLPFDDGFIGVDIAGDNKEGFFYSIGIYNPKLEKIKELTRIAYVTKSQKFEILKQTLGYYPFKGRLYVVGSEGLMIDVFDKAGKKLFSFKEPYKTVKFTSDDMEKVFESLKKIVGAQADALKNNLSYPDIWPVILSINASIDHFYVITWKSDKGKNEIYTFTQEGKLIKKSWVSLSFITFIQPMPYDIHNGQFFQLVENEDTEEWELRINEI